MKSFRSLNQQRVIKIAQLSLFSLIYTLPSCTSNNTPPSLSTDSKPSWSFIYYPDDGVEKALPFGLHDKTGLSTIKAVSSYLPADHQLGFEDKISNIIEKYLVRDSNYFSNCEGGSDGEVTNSFKEVRSKNSMKISGDFIATNCNDRSGTNTQISYIDGSLQGSIIDTWGGKYNSFNTFSNKSISLQAKYLTHHSLQYTDDSYLTGLNPKNTQLQKRIDKVTARVTGEPSYEDF